MEYHGMRCDAFHGSSMPRYLTTRREMLQFNAWHAVRHPASMSRPFVACRDTPRKMPTDIPPPWNLSRHPAGTLAARLTTRFQ